MILLAAEGRSNDEIAAALTVGRDVVSLWRKRFFSERLAGLEERPRPGRPRAFPPRGRRPNQSSRVHIGEVLGEGVGVNNVGRFDAVQDHVHDRDDV
ncbi:MAG: helix-turn-helix domain-containing protein, partial [Vicinamibacteria bacterium]|nr:helix-turn-helix domain-containing protein [Vicinamibacteria bacterium]